MIWKWSVVILLAAELSGGGRILVHGHRGARAVRPENTLPAFQYAIQVGVDVLELDMAVTKDNVLVVSHEPYLAPPICTGPRPKAAIHDLTLAEVRQYDCGSVKNPSFPKQQPVPNTRIPTLDEVFDLAPTGSFGFNVETKIFKTQPELAPTPAQFARLVVDAVRRHKLESRVIVQSFDFRTLQEIKELAPGMRLSALYSGPPRSFVAVAKEAGATIISPEYPLVNKAEVQAAHAAGLEVVPWTANTPEVWRKLIEAEVDAIITDDPAELISYLKRSSR